MQWQLALSNLRSQLSQRADGGVRAKFLLSSTAAVLSAAFVAFGPAPAQAQTLNAQNEALLSPAGNGCPLYGNVAATPNVDATPQLAQICNAGGDGGASAGGNSSSSQTTAATVENRREERLDDAEGETDQTAGGGLSTFASFDYEALNRDVTTFEDGYDSDAWRLTGGVDYRIGDDLLVGALFTYTSNDGDFAAGGDFETQSYSPALFASYSPTPNIFVDLSFSYTRNDYSRDRLATFTSLLGTTVSNVATGIVSSDAHDDQYGVQATAGYDFNVKGVSFGPRVGVNYSDSNLDDYTETGITGLELRFDDQSVKSLQTTFGVQASTAISTSFGVVLPELSASYAHEFDNDQRDIQVNYAGDLRATPLPFSFQNEKPDRDFGSIGAGALIILKNGIQPFVNFRALVGHQDYLSYTGTIGLRYEL